MFENMKNQVWEKMNDSIISTESLDNVNELIKDEKIVSFTWCGDEECGKLIEEITEIDILGTQSENSDYCKDIDGSKCIHCGKEGKYTALMAKTY